MSSRVGGDTPKASQRRNHRGGGYISEFGDAPDRSMEQAFASKPNEMTLRRQRQNVQAYRPPSFASDDRSTPGGVALPFSALPNSATAKETNHSSHHRGQSLHLQTQNFGNNDRLPDPFLDLSARMGQMDFSSGKIYNGHQALVGNRGFLSDHPMSAPAHLYNVDAYNSRSGSSLGSGRSSVGQLSASGTTLNPPSSQQLIGAPAKFQSSRTQPLSEEHRSRAKALAAAILSGACEAQSTGPEHSRPMQGGLSHENPLPYTDLSKGPPLNQEQALPQYVPASTPPSRNDPGVDFLMSPERGVPTLCDYASKLPFCNLCNDAQPTNWGVIKVSEVSLAEPSLLLPRLI